LFRNKTLNIYSIIAVKRLPQLHHAIKEAIKEFGIILNGENNYRPFERHHYRICTAVTFTAVVENNPNGNKTDVLVEFKRLSNAIQFLEEKQRTVTNTTFIFSQ
jgi:hypothetical protein